MGSTWNERKFEFYLSGHNWIMCEKTHTTVFFCGILFIKTMCQTFSYYDLFFLIFKDDSVCTCLLWQITLSHAYKPCSSFPNWLLYWLLLFLLHDVWKQATACSWKQNQLLGIHSDFITLQNKKHPSSCTCKHGFWVPFCWLKVYNLL